MEAADRSGGRPVGNRKERQFDECFMATFRGLGSLRLFLLPSGPVDC
jgi:hypothetical protein